MPKKRLPAIAYRAVRKTEIRASWHKMGYRSRESMEGYRRKPTRDTADFSIEKFGGYKGKSEIARDRLRQPSTNQIAVLTGATSAIYQSYLPDGRNHPAYIAHNRRARTCIKTNSTQQLMRR